MPCGDGTGPIGLGPGTGRRHRRCRGNNNFIGTGRTVFLLEKGWLWRAAIPTALTTLRDLLNPHGLLRQHIGGLLPESNKVKVAITSEKK